MNATTTTPATVPSCSPVRRGFGAMPCPKCGESATINIDLDDLHGDEALQCRECENTFGLADVRDFIETWNRVLAWIDQAPAIAEE